MIQVGDTLPQATLNVLDDGVQAVDTREFFAGRKVVLFAVPGAFTPTCHRNHLPGYVAQADAIKAKGIDAIVVTAVNDVFVMTDDMVAAVAEGLLESLGHRVHTVGTAEEALQYVLNGGRVDLVFSDIVMPGEMNGVELGRELRKHKPHLQVLLTTGYSDVAEHAIDCGFPMLRKPYDAAALQTAIQHCLKKAGVVKAA